MVYMFEISTASATGGRGEGVRRLFGGGAYLIFDLIDAALIRGRGHVVMQMNEIHDRVK